MDKQNHNIKIIIAPEFFAQDLALLQLFAENHRSNFSKEDFIQKIKENLVRIALIEDDPYGYAILDENKSVKEYYIENGINWPDEIKKLLLQP